MDHLGQRTEWPFSLRRGRCTPRSTSTYDPDPTVDREVRVIIAVHDERLREQYVDAARHNPLLRLLTSSCDIADARVAVHMPDVVVVGGTDRSVGSISAITVA